MLRQKKTKKKMMTWNKNGVRNRSYCFLILDDNRRSRSKELKSFFGFEARK